MSPDRTHDVAFQDDVIDRLARIEVHLESSQGARTDHESRLRTLERRQWLLAGVAVAIGPLLNKLGVHLPILQ